MKKKLKRTVPAAKMRRKLEERLSYQHDDEEWLKPGTEKNSYLEREYFPIAQLRWMHENILLKIIAALLTVFLIGVYLYFDLPLASVLAERMYYITTWNMDLQYFSEEAVPAIQQLWQKSNEPTLPEERAKESLNKPGPQSLILPVNSEITSAFGLRSGLDSVREEMHYGIDLAVTFDEPVVASLPGRVEEITAHPERGIIVYLRYSDTVRALYEQLKKSAVNKGEMVQAGQVIGFGDDAGYIHFELRVNGRPIDPAPLFDYSRVF